VSNEINNIYAAYLEAGFDHCCDSSLVWRMLGVFDQHVHVWSEKLARENTNQRWKDRPWTKSVGVRLFTLIL